MSHKHINSDPKVFGPIMWYDIHSVSMKMSQEAFIEYIKALIPSIPCLNCKTHAIEYITNNPIEHFLNIKDTNGNYIGMFKWTWIFHNDVNSRLNKDTLDWITAYNMYTGIESTCTLSCGN